MFGKKGWVLAPASSRSQNLHFAKKKKKKKIIIICLYCIKGYRVSSDRQCCRDVYISETNIPLHLVPRLFTLFTDRVTQCAVVYNIKLRCFPGRKKLPKIDDTILYPTCLMLK